MRPFLTAVPWITIGLLLLMFHFVGGTMAVRPGLSVDLPSGDLADFEQTSFVVLLVPTAGGDSAFFDDARYLLDDAASLEALGAHLGERLARGGRKSLLVLADRSLPSGRLTDFAALARRAGVERLLFGEKQSGAAP